MPEEWRVLEMTIPRSTLVQPPEIWDDVVDVCRRIPPLWDLANYVAVNPFLGFAGEPLPHAAGTIAQTLGGQVLPPFEYYRARWAQGAFGADELEQAAQRIGLPVTQLQAVLAGDAPMPTRPATLAMTFAEQYDRATGADWQARLVEHATLWCAAYVQERVHRADCSASGAPPPRPTARWRSPVLPAGVNGRQHCRTSRAPRSKPHWLH
jgi:hypothetical protein